MTTAVFVALALGVILAVALALAGRIDMGFSGSQRRGAPLLPQSPWTSDDVAKMRFRVGLRGYRMQDVDAMLEQLSQQLSQQSGQEPASGAEADETVPNPDRDATIRDTQD